MNAADLLGAGEVSNSARDTQHTMEAARRQTHRCRGVRQELAAGLVGRRDAVEQLSVGFGIGADAMAIVAVGLDLAGGYDTASDVGAALPRRRKRQVRGKDS